MMVVAAAVADDRSESWRVCAKKKRERLPLCTPLTHFRHSVLLTCTVSNFVVTVRVMIHHVVSLYVVCPTGYVYTGDDTPEDELLPDPEPRDYVYEETARSPIYSCYRLEDTHHDTWLSAMNQCWAEDAQLASLEDPVEMSRVLGTYKTKVLAASAGGGAIQTSHALDVFTSGMLFSGVNQWYWVGSSKCPLSDVPTSRWSPPPCNHSCAGCRERRSEFGTTIRNGNSVELQPTKVLAQFSRQDLERGVLHSGKHGRREPELDRRFPARLPALPHVRGFRDRRLVPGGRELLRQEAVPLRDQGPDRDLLLVVRCQLG